LPDEARIVENRYALAPNPQRRGMSEVYSAVDLADALQKCANKLFRTQLGDELLAEAFRRESAILRDLHHENVVELLNAGIDRQSERPFLALEWVDQNLNDWRASNPFKNWDQFCRDLGKPLVTALAYAHNRGIIHRDVKPSNVLVDAGGTPKLAESSKSTRKTIAKAAEKKRRAELENAFNSVVDKRAERIRSIKEVAAKFLEDYKERHRASATFAEYAVGHVSRLLGARIVVDISDETVKDYQTSRLKEKAAPKSINEEVSFLLRLLSEQGDVIRAKLRRQKALKLTIKERVARAFTPAEKEAMLRRAQTRGSQAIYPALALALHCGMRDKEVRSLPGRGWTFTKPS
jgi:serine/threonine protein kinase